PYPLFSENSFLTILALLAVEIRPAGFSNQLNLHDSIREILAITTAVGLIIFAGNLSIFVHLSLYLGLDSVLHFRRNHPSAFSVLYRSYSQSSSVNLTSEFRGWCWFVYVQACSRDSLDEFSVC
ncbi:hypothetical protein LINPERPRIM_LOCUS31317, partial [Linum perenne]